MSVTWNNKQTNVNDSKGSNISFQKCDNWVNGDVNSCKSTPPVGTTGWMPCGIGSDPTTISCSPYSTSFNCVWGQSCYAIQGLEPKWDSPATGCDKAGSILTVEKCNSWVNNDPLFCKTSKTKPANTIKWINCAIGSSPGGIAPGDKATGCSPLSKSKTDFPCVVGQNCFAVTEQTANADCKDIIGDIVDSIGLTSFFNSISNVFIGLFIFCIAMIFISILGASMSMINSK